MDDALRPVEPPAMIDLMVALSEAVHAADEAKRLAIEVRGQGFTYPTTVTPDSDAWVCYASRELVGTGLAALAEHLDRCPGGDTGEHWPVVGVRMNVVTRRGRENQ